MEITAEREKSLKAYSLTHTEEGGPNGGAECREQAGVAEMLMRLPASFKEDYSAYILAELSGRNDFETLRDTFMNFCESPFTCTQTAGEMHLHRNSLRYRLNKLKTLTGHDPRNIKEAFELWAAFLMTNDRGEVCAKEPTK